MVQVQVGSARQHQAIQWLDNEDVLERLAIPDGISARPLDITRSAKFEAHKDGSINVRFNKDRGQVYTVEDPEAMKAMAAFAGIGAETIKKFPTELVTPLVSWGIKQKEGVVVIADEDNRIHNVQDRSQLQPIMPAEQVLENMLAQWPEVKFKDAQMGGNYATDIVAITHDEERRLEELVTPGLHEFLPSGGDPFRAGVHIHTNPMGLSAPEIEPFTYRLVCLNGAVHTEYLHNAWGRGYGEGDELWQWFREGLQASDMAVGNIMGKYAEMIGETILPNDRARVIEGYARQARLGTEDRQALRDQAMNEPPRNMYDLFNLATATATHRGHKTLQEMLSHQRRATVNTTTADAHGHYCPTCKR
ncbi:MAG: hypothetical protein COB10_12745 [Planctomycetota bacterium]|nr:MAG: hypothetical protein COB10_12745 [Planctomycetota bacterium]